jgi:hypothetical protein
MMSKTDAAGWQNRIVGHGLVDALELIPNPANWRQHPGYQRAALAGALGEVGWVQQVIVNRTTGRLIDGHLRVELARERGEQVPVTYVELTEAEERLVLATLDPLAGLAATDETALAELLAGIETQDQALDELLNELAFDVEPGPEAGSGSRRTLGQQRVVKIALSVPNLAVVEQALARVGIDNRGAALVAICEAYLEEG